MLKFPRKTEINLSVQHFSKLLNGNSFIKYDSARNDYPKTNKWTCNPKDPKTPIPVNNPNWQPKKNLIYHICPMNNLWQWNVDQLLERIHLFDGVRSISVVTDSNTSSFEEVKKYFGHTRIDHWYNKKNDPNLGEAISFFPLMSTLPLDDSVTFYAHAKGIRYTKEPTKTSVRIWTDLLYKTNLDHWPETYNLLKQFPFCGSFKFYYMLGEAKMPINSNFHWFYAGTFFWFRNMDIFKQPNWSYLINNCWAIEFWPSTLFDHKQTACLFFSNCNPHLYDFNVTTRLKHDYQNQIKKFYI